MNYKKQITALEIAVKAKEARKRMHDPFVLYRPWSILNDQYYLYYYPEGLFQKPQKSGPMSYDEVCRAICSYPEKMRCQISLGECTEWLFAFHLFGDQSSLYTREQLDRMTEKDISTYPELAYMLTDSGKDLLQAMLKLPQTLNVAIEDLQQAIRLEE